MSEEVVLRERLQRVEALIAGGATAGERAAANSACKRLKEHLAQILLTEPAIEHRFAFSDVWSRKLFMALLRRYDISPYRREGELETTVMARVPKRFVDESLWPEFEQMNAALMDFLDDVTDRVIAKNVFAQQVELEVKPDIKMQVVQRVNSKLQAAKASNFTK